MKKTSLSSALMIAVVGAVALVGCKKKEEAAPTPPPAASAPAPMVESAPAAPVLSVTAVTVGNAAAADMTVAPVAVLTAKVAGEQNATLNATDTGTTNIEFANSKPWPAGKYTADVTVDGKAAGMPQQFEVK